MADAILMSGGAGGVTSDDVTAGKSQVLQGYRTVTTDSDDEVVEGTIKSINTADDNYNINKSNAFGIDEFGRMWIDMPHGNGYYHRYDNKPHTCIASAKLGDATADKVLQGCTFTSKTGVKVQGEMVNRGNGMDAIDFYNAHWESSFVARMEPGYYGQNGQWKPYVSIPYAVLANVVGVDANKMLDTLTIAGKKGQIKMINTQDNNYRLNKSTAFGIDGWSDRSNPVFWIDFPHGNGYYHRADGHPHTCIDATNLGTAGADSVLQGQTATSQHGVKFEGSIPRWICNTGDVITALGGEGFAWDDTHASRGRGIVVKIPNGHYIQGANWAFLPSPNLLPGNIRKGVNINGVTGTMEDPSVGRVPFRNATFDNVLISGVANIGLGKDLNNYSIPSTEIRDGIIRFDTRYTGLHWYAPMSTLNESVTLAHSVNLSPFKTIRLGLKFPYGGDWGAVNSMGDLVGVVWALSTNHYAEYNPYTKIKVNPNMVKKTGTSRIIPQVSKVLLDTRGLDIPTGAEYFVDVDVSDLQGHHRIVLGFAVINPSGDKVTSRTIVRATNDIFGISHIEFIN